MYVLSLVITMIAILGTLTYATLENFKDVYLLRNEQKKYFTLNHSALFNATQQTLYNDHTKQDKFKKLSQEDDEAEIEEDDEKLIKESLNLQPAYNDVLGTINREGEIKKQKKGSLRSFIDWEILLSGQKDQTAYKATFDLSKKIN